MCAYPYVEVHTSLHWRNLDGFSYTHTHTHTQIHTHLYIYIYIYTRVYFCVELAKGSVCHFLLVCEKASRAGSVDEKTCVPVRMDMCKVISAILPNSNSRSKAASNEKRDSAGGHRNLRHPARPLGSAVVGK